MKRTLIAAMLISLLTSSLAMADPPGARGDDGGARHEWRHDHDRGEHRGWRRGDDGRRDWRRGDGDRHEWRADRERRARFDSGEYRRPRGYYHRAWVRGERLPIAFRAPEYIIPNVLALHLAVPPAGYYWVRVDDNAVLAAIATGVVLDVVSHQFR